MTALVSTLKHGRRTAGTQKPEKGTRNRPPRDRRLPRRLQDYADNRVDGARIGISLAERAMECGHDDLNLTSTDREIPPKVTDVGRTKEAGLSPSGSSESAILDLRTPPRSVPPSTGKSGDTTPLGQELVLRATRADKTPPSGTGDIVE